MQHHLTRIVGALAFATAIVAPSLVSATDLTSDQMGRLSTMTNKYFDGLVTGNAPEVLAVTSKEFRGTPLNGTGTESANELIADWKNARLAFGSPTGGVKIVSASTDGMMTTVMVATEITGSSTADNPGTSSVSRNALHKMTWMKRTSGWKLTSDIVEKVSTTN